MEDALAPLHLRLADLFDAPEAKAPAKVEVARYPYTDADGTVLFEKIRYVPKSFIITPPGAVGKLGKKPLYRLPELQPAIQAGKIVLLVEGEKDADRLRSEGYTATCNFDGAGKFNKPEYAEYLRGAKVLLIADNDGAGHRHADQAKALLERAGIAVTVKIPAAGKDVSDHLDAGFGIDDLQPYPGPRTDELKPDTKLVDDSGDTGKGLKLRTATDLELPPPPKWLGVGWLPRSALTVMVGEEGIGKSLLWVRMASHVTTGKPFAPFGMPAREPADVVIIVTEDSPSEVMSRLHLAGADPNRIHFFAAENDGTGTPVFGSGYQGDMLLLDALLDERDTKPAMLVVDAWLDTVAGNLNIRDTQQARAALDPWKQLATKHNLAVLLVTHTNRTESTNIRDLMGGTAALRQKARMVLFAARPKSDHDSPVQHLWVGPDKSNVTGLVDAVKFQVRVEQVRDRSNEDPGTSAHLTAPASALMTIRNLLVQWKQEESEANRKPTKAEECQEAIRDYLSEGDGQCRTRDLKDHLQQSGYGKTVAEMAMSNLGESVRNAEFGGEFTFRLKGSQPSYEEPVPQEVSEVRKVAKDGSSPPILPNLPILPASYLSGPEIRKQASDGLQAGDLCTNCHAGRLTDANASKGISLCNQCLFEEPSHTGFHGRTPLMN
ncbi:AAA family ATPase [Pseudarthrobacter sulfonivorans]|uniref:AAA family ATPase n=1 Tax=Pseudarthrobacter sulfonivorans TaxID=121292 RepID=UPI002863C557|nr:AAA family ATPase [Pseudarthrobacter sulfonivorans]MDR6414063.1 5S rRNA maturation endonuclease (ribonuclease M5) [Pseudarthrobacter sulfonivorans]